MILMNQPTCVVNETVQPDGNVVLVNQTIDAFQNGYSVMVKTIVEITAMNYQKIAQSATPKLTSSAQTTDVFQSKFYFLFISIKLKFPIKKI